MRPALRRGTKGSILRVQCGRTSSTAGIGLRRGSRLLGLVLLGSAALALTAPAVARADASLSPGLAQQAKAHPNTLFKVIVQGDPGTRSEDVAQTVEHGKGRLERRFVSIVGVSAELTGKQILELADDEGIRAITADAPVILAGAGLTNVQRWPYAAGVAKFWSQIGNQEDAGH